ncbi:hypothetical protein [uncultured Aquimarina sp.]|uniref:hypothetical protein n=1 Tax=uncultured Aquimarina sp. TaxID=575652 RepID=UPI0026231284|nr:hypothetical protein [uncultured Aquimarina sp.]
MKIECTCGNIISDSSDYIMYKGRFIPDRNWDDFWDAIDFAIEKSGPSEKEKEDACMKLRMMRVFDSILECIECGKLFVDDENGNLVTYSPDSKKYNGIFKKK